MADGYPFVRISGVRRNRGGDGYAVVLHTRDNITPVGRVIPTRLGWWYALDRDGKQVGLFYRRRRDAADMLIPKEADRG